MRDLLNRKASSRTSPLEAQLAALRTVYDQIPADQRASFLARLDEVARAWSGDATAEPQQLPGHHQEPRTRRPAEGAFRPGGTLNRRPLGGNRWLT